MYEPIVIFNNDDNKYGIVSVDGTILFFKYENNRIQLDLTDEEITLIYEVFKSLQVNEEKSLNLGIKKINNKDFEILYDPNSKLYYWFQIINGERYYSSDEDTIMLNYKYNHMPFVAYDGDIFDWKEEEQRIEQQRRAQRKKTIKRIFKTGTKTIILSVSALSIYMNLTNSSLASIINNHVRIVPNAEQAREANIENNNFDVIFETFESRPYNFQEVEAAIDGNQNLSDEEKTFIKNLKFYFDENHNYMDMDKIISRLQNLKIEYNREKCKNTVVTGEYQYETGIITMYNTDSYANCNKIVLLHEVMHVMQMYNTNKLTLELSNELATREAARRLNDMGLMADSEKTENSLHKNTLFGTGYNPCMSVEYLLANILSEETLKQFQNITDEDILINELKRIDAQGEYYEQESIDEQVIRFRAIQLLESINSLADRDENGYNNIVYSQNKYNYIYDQIDHYYKKEHGKSMKESLSADIVKYDIAYNNWDPRTPEYMATLGIVKEEAEKQTHDPFARFGEKKYVLPKSYFSDEYENPIIMFDSPQYVEVEITPELDEKYEKEYQVQLDGYEKKQATEAHEH